MGYIGHHGVATLRRYKYSGVDHSLVAKYILQPFWSRFVNIFPLWFPFFTNTLILPIVNGPTEGLMLIYVCHFFTFFTGAEWWAQDFQKSMPLLGWVPFVPEIPVYDIALCLMIAFAVIPTIGSKSTKLVLQLYSIHNVYKVVEARKGSMVLALAMLFPFGLLLAGVLVWSYLSPSDIMRNQPHLLIIGTGFAFGFLVGRMILAHLCDEPKGLKTGMCMSLAYFPFAIANALTARLDDGNPLVDEQLVLLMYCLFTVALYMHFATSVIHEITNVLGIHCFRITRKKA
ncbi:Choline/ethanolaminephosphotransferase 1 [Dichanthelium oligosanthes]|uniref:Choline/ethanolaminephosphotransferase 1 n=1 Tax=Dichanthelium oligosanthes TaxID=888268 RepID=A0A1E5UQV9_9POAL|nr:Choline/ethanolaminephosphotransferase 1 [Dichanthelium oligosanthes]